MSNFWGQIIIYFSYHYSWLLIIFTKCRACDAALADLIDYVRQDGVRVAAFDATNSTFERRRHIMQRLKDAGLGAKRMFVESICDNEGVSFCFVTEVFDIKDSNQHSRRKSDACCFFFSSMYVFL